MKVRWDEVRGPLFTLFVMVALPLGAVWLLPEETFNQLEALGLNVKGLAAQMATLGVIVAGLGTSKALVAKTSMAYLLLDLSSILASLGFALLVVGFGDAYNLGYSSLKITQGMLMVDLVMNLRVFVYISVGAITLSVLRSIARFLEARVEAQEESTIIASTNS